MGQVMKETKGKYPPDLIIDGDGQGAVLTPVLEDGTISSITVIEKGEGYTDANTSISILVPGEGAEFRASIQNWRLNLFQRHIDNFSTDDGIIADQFNVDRGLQYAHLYAPRKLREAVFGTDLDGNTIISGEYDSRLNTITNSYSVSISHNFNFLFSLALYIQLGPF